MIGTWIDEGLEYFDVARGIKPDSKFFDKYELVVSLEWITISPIEISPTVLTARGTSRRAISPLNKERNRDWLLSRVFCCFNVGLGSTNDNYEETYVFCLGPRAISNHLFTMQ